MAWDLLLTGYSNPDEYSYKFPYQGIMVSRGIFTPPSKKGNEPLKLILKYILLGLLGSLLFWTFTEKSYCSAHKNIIGSCHSESINRHSDESAYQLCPAPIENFKLNVTTNLIILRLKYRRGIFKKPFTSNGLVKLSEFNSFDEAFAHLQKENNLTVCPTARTPLRC